MSGLLLEFDGQTEVLPTLSLATQIVGGTVCLQNTLTNCTLLEQVNEEGKSDSQGGVPKTKAVQPFEIRLSLRHILNQAAKANDPVLLHLGKAISPQDMHFRCRIRSHTSTVSFQGCTRSKHASGPVQEKSSKVQAIRLCPDQHIHWHHADLADWNEASFRFCPLLHSACTLRDYEKL